MGTSKILIDGVGIDLTADTVAANKLLSGIKAHDSSGNAVTGSIPSKAAATYTPGTTDQTIAAGQFLSGAQTIKGDADLISANIRSGKSIFGVAGSLTPGITPSGTKSITENGTFDVTAFASANVSVTTSKTGVVTFPSFATQTITHDLGRTPRGFLLIPDQTLVAAPGGGIIMFAYADTAIRPLFIYVSSGSFLGSYAGSGHYSVNENTLTVGKDSSGSYLTSGIPFRWYVW